MESNIILEGDCLERLKELPDCCVDSIITDPPYGLSFMGKKWDYDVPSVDVWKECLRVLRPGGTALIFAGSRTQHRMAVNVEDAGFILKDCIMWIYGSGFPKATDISKQLDKNSEKDEKVIKAKRECGLWLKEKRGNKSQIEIAKHFPSKTGGLTGCVTNWEKGYNLPTWEMWLKLKEVLNLNDKFDYLIEGRPKDYIEAEREIIGKDKRTFNYASFDFGREWDLTSPATNNAKIWDGWKSHGLKPAYEPILVAMKPNDGSYANNALKHGVSGLNIDECRIPSGTEHMRGNVGAKITESDWKNNSGLGKPFVATDNPLGRFPANVILECTCDELKTGKIDGAVGHFPKNCNMEGHTLYEGGFKDFIQDEKYTEKECVVHTNPECPCFNMDSQSGVSNSNGGQSYSKTSDIYGKYSNDIIVDGCGFGDKGGASRFFYCAKASKSERNKGCENLEIKQSIGGGGTNNTSDDVCGKYGSIKSAGHNHHPTVKPLKLMEYLCKLTKTPTGGIVLDPYSGSGTTAIACLRTGRKYILIERESEYILIAKARINHFSKQNRLEDYND